MEESGDQSPSAHSGGHFSAQCAPRRAWLAPPRLPAGVASQVTEAGPRDEHGSAEAAGTGSVYFVGDLPRGVCDYVFIIDHELKAGLAFCMIPFFLESSVESGDLMKLQVVKDAQ